MSARFSISALLALTVSQNVWAESSAVFSATGLQPGRDSFSQLPFEHIDTATGSVVLTFSDLALPGDGGSELRFLRTYNTKDGNWTFGIAGVVLRVADQWPAPQGSTDSPILYTDDGGGQAVATQVNSGATVDSFRVMMT